MERMKILSGMIVFVLVSTGFGMMSSDSAQAAFIQTLSNNGLPSTFIPYDSAWNDAGTMAVVVGHEAASLSTNAYAYYPGNDTYWPIDNAGNDAQSLRAVDYFSEPIYDFPTVLLVNADYSHDGLITFYENLFAGINANVVTWTVWEEGDPSYWIQGKPTTEDMAPYDVVIWVATRDMNGWYGSGDALNPTDAAEIASYLGGGGNFFLSNTRFSDYPAMGTLAEGYLGVGTAYMNTNFEYGAQPVVSDPVFGELSFSSQGWGSYGWSGNLGWTDQFVADGLGIPCFRCGNDMSVWETTGLRYDSGTFRTIYFGFPLETLPLGYASDLMQLALDWFCPAAITGPGIIDQSDEYMGNAVGKYVCGDPGWAQSFVPSADTIEAVEFLMYRTQTGLSDYFLIQICQDDGGGQPGTPIPLAYAYLYQESIPIADAEWVRCTLSEAASLTIGNTYWITCSIYNPSYGQYWFIDQAMTYEIGEAMRFDGDMWSYENYYDWMFRTYSSTTGGGGSSVTIYPSKDTTIYSPSGSLSNGAGQYLLAGRTMSSDNMRALMEFDIAGAIPRHSRIESVSLQMYCCNWQDGMFYETWLYPLYGEWGEGASDASVWEESGAPASTGDATWSYRYYTSDAWGIGGGDFGAISGYGAVGTEGWYTWSDAALANDVQTWLDMPTSNHGWIMAGSESQAGSIKWFHSSESPSTSLIPRLTVTYTEPTIIGYRDAFWIAGDWLGAPPTNVYKFVPDEGDALITVDSPPVSPDLFAIAADDDGNPLCAGNYCDYIYYHDGSGWVQVSSGSFDVSIITTIDFNPNDGRFYLAGYNGLEAVPVCYYTEPAPISEMNSAYRYAIPSLTWDCYIRSLAWNEMYDYGLAVGDEGLFLKVWPYGHWGNGTMRYELEETSYMNNFKDVSWDADGWNEAAIVGTYSTSKMYWRYYHSNPQILEGYNGLAGAYYTCAFKPPSSPKWAFIPSGSGSIRVNVEEKDQSSELIISSEFPHAFSIGMWKRSDAMRVSTLNTQVEVDTTYTFLIVGNYTRNNIDCWDTSLGMYLQVWWDFGNTGGASVPADMTWSNPVYRTRQFNVSCSPPTNSVAMTYPAQVAPANPEFSVHSFWEDPTAYGADGRTHRYYLNVTFGKQTMMAPGDGAFSPAGTNIHDRNLALNDAQTWDFKVLMYDTGTPEAFNATYDEFGVQRFGQISVSGSPSGSIPPGAQFVLATPSTIIYSSNTPHQLNVSIPDLAKVGNPAVTIPATYVDVMNIHSTVTDATYTDISAWTQFAAANDNLCVWGKESGTFISPPGHGTITAGYSQTDYSAAAAALPFEPTRVSWRVEVPAGTQEGVYRATITITLWS